MAREYYYLVAGLPSISIEDAKPARNIQEFMSMLKEQISSTDYNLVPFLFFPDDNENLLNLLFQNEKWNGCGYFKKEALQSEILNPTMIPDYMRKVIIAFQEDENPRYLDYHQRITEDLFKLIEGNSNSFLQKWYSFDCTVRNITTALNCRVVNLNYENQLIGDAEWKENLIKSNAADFGLAKTNEIVERIIKIWNSVDILKKEIELDRYRWTWIDEVNFFHYFDIDLLLGYVAKLRIAERWLQLDEDTGKKKVRHIIRQMEDSFSFKEDYTTIKKGNI